jgi:hypothetical protein
VTATMSAELITSVKAAGRQPIGDQAFKLAPGMNGSVTPLTFTEAALACVYDTDRGKQVFVLLGILLAANTGQGNPAQKTRSIPINRNVALSLSPAAFRSFVFCPGIATPLGLPPGTAAPGVCGGAPVTVSGVTITGVTDRFTAGSINVDVTFTNSGFCYTTDGAVTMTLTPKVSAGTLSWAVSSEQPTITVSIPYYCYLATIVLHPILGVVLWVFDSVADSLASRTAASSLKSLLEGILLPGNPGPFVVEEVLVDEEGLTIASTATVQLPLAMQPSASLKATREFVRSEQVASGELVLPAPCKQEAKYRWSEERRWLRQVLVVETSLYGHPIYASWELLDASGVSIPLIGISGTVQVPVNATYQTASSTTAVQRDATISWRQFGLGGSMLILTNDPSDGSYIVEVAAQVSNCANTLQRTLVHPLAFDGHVLERHASGLIGLLECLPEWVDRFELPPDILREEWSLSLPTSMAGRALMAIVAVDDPAVDQLAQTIPVLLAPELRDAALRFSSAKEFNE